MQPENNISKNDTYPISDGYDLESVASDVNAIRHLILNESSEELEVISKKEWQFIADEYAFIGFLINQKIILYWVKGNVRKKHSKAVYERMKKVVAFADQSQQLYHILDLSNINAFSLSARKVYEDITNALAPHWKHSYYVLSGLGTTIFRIYTSIHPGFSDKVTLARSLPKAIHIILRKEHSEQARSKRHSDTSFDPHQASHQELLQEYLYLTDKHEKLHYLHKNRAQKLLEMVGRMTWHKDFDTTDFHTDYNDAFYNVFGALALLQYDMKEIFNQQKRANQTLEREVATRTSQLSSVIENTSEMIMSVNCNWQVQVINTAFQRRFHEAYGQNLKSGDFLLSKYPEHIRDFWQTRFEKAFRGEGFSEMIVEMVKQEKTFFQITFNPIKTEQEVREVSLFGQDITTLKKVEEKAKEYEYNLIKALKIAGAASWEFDLQTRMIKIGKEGLNVIGLPTDEDLILSMEEFVERFLYPEDISFLQERLAWAEQNEGDPHFQDQFPYRLYHQNGTLLQFMLYSHYKANAPKVIFGISQDITAQKEAEEQLLQQNLALKKVNGELDQFVYSVSHDLRAPLSSVLGLIHIAREEEDHSTIMHYLDLQEKSILKLDSFIREIMDLSKNARLTIQKEAVDFQKLIDEIFEEQQYDQESHSIKKISEIDQTLDFYSDTRRIRVILRNLISNALRYANLNQPQPFVKVCVQVNRKGAKIAVEDNGVGIDNEHQARIYEMFYRANQNKSGSGLGLYIVKETVDKLNATIDVYSEPGKMTKFTVYLPTLD
ncbi:signal transduction histidine kinase [Catalinimonas alkaloidigena]|uniref:PAS domain-containing sensor histidine kinase n=1 Tax=Catalinimonas alkaloidigena TaxID=1075417 RepID=UPI0024071802|nr:PAS domain-containing sensor histidine kinase [Catalinimonas alkaloidigena]MDF9795005.1 signal transduction histidine kinase [Catalinimonas alkaloidigena]